MKTTAGVILIIAALFNLFASFGYFAGGALTTGGAQYVDSYIESAENVDNLELSDSNQSQVKEVRDALQAGSAIGGGLMVYGVFLLLSVGILIAGAVFLFKDSNAKFVMVAGVVAIAAELIGILIISFGILNVLGIVGGVLAIIAAKSIGQSITEDVPEEASE